MNALKIFGCVAAILLMVSAKSFSQTERSEDELQMLADNVFNLSEVMLHDVTSPPAASRVYAYACLGAYQTASLAKGKVPEFFIPATDEGVVQSCRDDCMYKDR